MRCVRWRRLSELKQAYESLGSHESLRPEIALHVGYLESAAMNWTSALDHLRRVPRSSEARITQITRIGRLVRLSPTCEALQRTRSSLGEGGQPDQSQGDGRGTIALFLASPSL